MALRNQPYLPLYVQDFLTDEKLAYCSASATGVYIRIMCLMHKSERYGTILLKENFKRSENLVNCFALQLSRQLPYDLNTIEDAILELITEDVLYFDGDFMIQKRMVKDSEISELRKSAGKLGGKKTQDKIKNFDSDFALAKLEANTENENENESVVKDVNDNSVSVSSSSSSSIGEKIEKKSKRTKTTMTDEEYGRMMISKGFKCYGEFGNVFLSEKNVEDAIEKVGTFVLKRTTEFLSAYKETKPEGAQHYKKDYAVMCSWAFDRVKQDMQKEGLNWREYWGREMRERENAKAKLKDPLFNSEQNGTT
jgi:hypothetical protein